MKPTAVRLRLEDIEGVSDRTVRTILGDLARVCRRAQFREVDEVLRFAQLSRREQQSLNDRLKFQFADVPVYYFKQAREGSLIVSAAVGGFMIWLLQNTLGETVKEGYKQSQFHKKIIDWVKTERPKRLPELITEEAKSHDFLSGRAILSGMETREAARVTTVEILLRVTDYDVIKQPEAVTDRSLIERGNAFLREIG